MMLQKKKTDQVTTELSPKIIDIDFNRSSWFIDVGTCTECREHNCEILPLTSYISICKECLLTLLLAWLNGEGKKCESS